MDFKDFTTREQRLQVGGIEMEKHTKVKTTFQVIATIVVLWAVITLYFLVTK